MGGALLAAAGLGIAAVAVPLGLPTVVSVAATLFALLPVVAVSSGAGTGLAWVGDLARSAPRAVLAAAAVVAVWDRHVFVSSSAVAPDDLLAALVVVAAILLPRTPRSTGALIGLALATYAVAGAILVAAKPYHSDAVVAAHGGAELLVAGHHPYADFDMVEQLRRFGLPETFATPLEDGTRLRALQYPALAILVPAPFVAAGLADVRVLYLVEILVMFALVVGTVPAAWRLPALAACVGGIAVSDQFVLAGVDPLWALMTLAAWLTRRHRLSAVLLGLAIASRQPAWLMAPFLVAWAWREAGRREALARAAISLGVALALQAPFLLTAPATVIAGITAPALLPLEAWGVGPAKLAADAGIALPRGLFLAAAAAAYLAALGSFARRRARGALALPLLPLWLSWRALLSYFALVGLFVVVDEPSG